ncbi:MAG: DMT family transporter [Candidatus Micrarchaeota archaeon]|nr:DMT family transporter [Candidatus Micrarchaeota archaeon]
MVGLATIAAILPAIIWAFTVTMEKRLSSIAGTFRTSLLLTGFGILPILALFFYSYSATSSYVAILSIISGIFFALGALLYYKSLETEQMSNSSATGLAQPAILIAFSILVLNESISVLQAIGGLIIVAGVFLIITNKKMEVNRRLIPALLANVSWAGYWIFASYAILASNQVGTPLLISRATGFIIVIIFSGLLLAKSSFRPSKNSSLKYVIILGLFAGVFDAVGNVIFGYVVNLNLLSIASIFTAAMPLFITALGYLIYGERMTREQWVGMAVAIAGALIIAVG